MPFQIVELELDKAGEVVARHVSSVPFEDRLEAVAVAARSAQLHDGGHGRDEKNDYWWARDLRGVNYRIFVESF